MRFAALLALSLCLPASANAAPIFFAVDGTNVGSVSTIIHNNYNNGNGSHRAILDPSGPMSSMVLGFSNNQGNGVPTNGDTIASFGPGSFQLKPKGNSNFPAGQLTLHSLSLTLGNGADGQGHHIQSGTMAWSFAPDNNDPDYMLSDIASFSHVESGIFNHVSITDLQNGEFLIDIDLWGGFLHPSNLFPKGLGIDLSLTGQSVAPASVPMPEPAAWITWILTAVLAFGAVWVRRNTLKRRPARQRV